MKKILSLLMIFSLLLAVTACDESDSEYIRIGGIGPLSGSLSVFGESVREGINLAIEEINAAGGVALGDTKKELQLVDYLNDEGDGTKAAAAFDSLYSRGVDFILGGVTSGATLGLIGAADGTNIPILTPTGTADQLTVGASGNERNLRKNVFRACFYDSFQGGVLAEFAKSEGKTKAAILYNTDDAYSKGLYESFKAKAISIELEYVEISYQTATADFAAQWSSIINADVDVVFIPDYYEKVATIIETGYNAGYDDMIIGADGWDGITGVDGIDAKFLENAYFSNHFAADDPNTKVQTFITAYKEKYNGKIANGLAVLGYDSVYIMKAALEKAGTTDYLKVIDALSASDFSVDIVTGEGITFKDGNPVKKAAIVGFDGFLDLKFYKHA